MDAVLHDNRELITPWYPFENEAKGDLYHYIENMALKIAHEITNASMIEQALEAYEGGAR